MIRRQISTPFIWKNFCLVLVHKQKLKNKKDFKYNHANTERKLRASVKYARGGGPAEERGTDQQNHCLEGQKLQIPDFLTEKETFRR